MLTSSQPVSLPPGGGAGEFLPLGQGMEGGAGMV